MTAAQDLKLGDVIDGKTVVEITRLRPYDVFAGTVSVRFRPHFTGSSRRYAWGDTVEVEG